MRQAVGYAVTAGLLVVWLSVYLIWSNDLFQFWKTGFRLLAYQQNAENYAIGISIAIGLILLSRRRLSAQDQIFIIFCSAVAIVPSFIFQLVWIDVNIMLFDGYFSYQLIVTVGFFGLVIAELAALVIVARFKFRATALASFTMLASWSIVIRILSIYVLALSTAASG